MVGATSVRTRARARSSLGVSTAGMRHSPRATAAVTVLSVPYNQIHPLGFLKPSGHRSPKSTKTRRVGEVRHPSQIRIHARRCMEMVFVATAAAAAAAVASCAAAGKTPAPLRQSVSRSVGSSSGARCPRRRLTSLSPSLYLAAATKGMLT